jgi:hypothetical protein
LNAAFTRTPYLYFAELGGVELDENRQVRAGRLPNPLIPFSYLALGDLLGTMVLPVFSPSPSIQEELEEEFREIFGDREAGLLIGLVLRGEQPGKAAENLRARAVRAVEALAQRRRRRDTLRPEDWGVFAGLRAGRERALWLLTKAMPWQKRITIPVPATLRALLDAVQRAGAVAIGAEQFPICLVGGVARAQIAHEVTAIHGTRVPRYFIEWLTSSSEPMVVVWVAGFKPAGGDSRPDRGLVPMARMIFGDGVEILTVVYGPARRRMLELLFSDPWQLAETNGLWESIVRFSTGVLVDSSTSQELPQIGLLMPSVVRAAPRASEQRHASADIPLSFGEHEVASVLHLLFSGAESVGCFESLCNPPGGDWSGLSYRLAGQDVRWTSLPRVTAADAKRPDHVVQFLERQVILAIESKNTAGTLEHGIGPRLGKYVSDLLATPANVARRHGQRFWQPSGAAAEAVPEIISGAASRFDAGDNLERTRELANVDFVLALEFLASEGRVVLHVKGGAELEWFFLVLHKLAERFGGRIVIQVD